MRQKKAGTYRKLEMAIRTGVLLTPADCLDDRLLKTRIGTRRARRNFVEVVSNVMIIIGGLVDPVMGLARGLTIWSLLVFGAGASSLVLIRAYMGGLLGETMMFGGVFITLLIAMLIGLRVTTAARRAQIEIIRMPLPGWMTEEV